MEAVELNLRNTDALRMTHRAMAGDGRSTSKREDWDLNMADAKPKPISSPLSAYGFAIFIRPLTIFVLEIALAACRMRVFQVNSVSKRAANRSASVHPVCKKKCGIQFTRYYSVRRVVDLTLSLRKLSGLPL